MDKKWRHPARIPWSVIAIFLFALLVAVVLFSVGAANSTSRSADVWFEATKAGLQLGAIVILGGAVAWAFRALDQSREDRRRLDEYLGAVADELWDAYRQVKAVRRKLLAAGFRQPASGTVSAEQSAEFRAQIDVLIDAQLTLEKLKRGVETQPSLYSPDDTGIRSLLRDAEDYVNKVIATWEHHGNEIKAGADLDQVTKLENLQPFLGPARAPEGLKVKLSKPVEHAAARIQSLRFGTQARAE